MEMFKDLAGQLCSITGFDAMSLQPNSGASGEYAGLMAIRAYHRSRWVVAHACNWMLMSEPGSGAYLWLSSTRSLLDSHSVSG